MECNNYPSQRSDRRFVCIYMDTPAGILNARIRNRKLYSLLLTEPVTHLK